MNLHLYDQRSNRELVEDYANSLEELRQSSKKAWLVDTGMLLAVLGFLCVMIGMKYSWVNYVFWFFTFPLQIGSLIFKGKLSKLDWVPVRGSDEKMLEMYEQDLERFRSRMAETEEVPGAKEEGPEGGPDPGLQEVNRKDPIQ